MSWLYTLNILNSDAESKKIHARSPFRKSTTSAAPQIQEGGP